MRTGGRRYAMRGATFRAVRAGRGSAQGSTRIGGSRSMPSALKLRGVINRRKALDAIRDEFEQWGARGARRETRRAVNSGGRMCRRWTPRARTVRVRVPSGHGCLPGTGAFGHGRLRPGRRLGMGAGAVGGGWAGVCVGIGRVAGRWGRMPRCYLERPSFCGKE